MPHIHVLQHEHFEGTANIGRWAVQSGYEVSHTLLQRGEELPSRHDYDWLLVLGGGMGAYEEDKYAWLRPEKAFIRQAIDQQRKVMGICLGAQLIAGALGAAVFPGPEQEIGWFPVTRTEAASRWFEGLPCVFTPLHWHGDTFDLPRGAVLLAESEAYRNQAFAYGDNVLALQFHLELSRLDVQAFLAGGNAPQPGRWVQTGQEILSRPQDFEASQTLLARLLEQFASGEPVLTSD